MSRTSEDAKKEVGHTDQEEERKEMKVEAKEVEIRHKKREAKHKAKETAHEERMRKRKEITDAWSPKWTPSEEQIMMMSEEEIDALINRGTPLTIKRAMGNFFGYDADASKDPKIGPKQKPKPKPKPGT